MYRTHRAGSGCFYSWSDCGIVLWWLHELVSQLTYSELINRLLVEASESVKSNFVRVDYFFHLFFLTVFTSLVFLGFFVLVFCCFVWLVGLDFFLS